MSISSRLKVARQHLGLSQEEIAEELGLKRRGYQENESGRTQPNAKSIQALVRLGVNANWLLTGEGPMLSEQLSDSAYLREDAVRAIMGDEEAEERRQERAKEFDNDLKAVTTTVDKAMDATGISVDRHWRQMIATWVNSYGFEEQDIADLASLVSSQAELANEFALIPGYNVEVAAGSGTLPSNEEPTRKLAFRHKWLRFRGLNPDSLVLVFAKGDSMEPTISDNNTLMIDTSQRDLSDGQIYVIRTDGHLIVKRIQKLWNKGILLLSDNKEYKEQQVEPNEADDLEVIGRVVWIGKDV